MYGCIVYTIVVGIMHTLCDNTSINRSFLSVGLTDTEMGEPYMTSIRTHDGRSPCAVCT